VDRRLYGIKLKEETDRPKARYPACLLALIKKSKNTAILHSLRSTKSTRNSSNANRRGLRVYSGLRSKL